MVYRSVAMKPSPLMLHRCFLTRHVLADPHMFTFDTLLHDAPPPSLPPPLPSSGALPPHPFLQEAKPEPPPRVKAAGIGISRALGERLALYRNSAEARRELDERVRNHDKVCRGGSWTSRVSH